jgi:hypothetical protein
MAAQSTQAAYLQPALKQKAGCSKDLAKEYASKLKIYFKQYRLIESEFGV